MRVVADLLQDQRSRYLGAAVGCTLLASIVVLSFTHTVVIIGGLLVACLAVAVLRFPIAALAMLLALQPFHSAIVVALGNRGGISVGPLRHWEDALVLVLFVRALAERILRDRRLPIQNVGDNVVLVYVLVFVVLATASPARSTVFEALAVYTEGPLLFLAIRWMRPSRRDLWICVIAFVAAATIMGGAALYEHFGPHEGFLRWYGVDQNQVSYSASQHPYRSASFLIDFLILAFYLAESSAFTAAVASIRTRWRPLASVAFVACAGGLITTITRSGYVGGAFGVGVVLVMVVRNPRRRLALVGLTIVIVGGLSIHYVRNGTLTRGEGDTAHKNALQRDVNFLTARPMGYGLGSTDRFRFVEGKTGPGQLGATESTYMARALEGGVQGLAVYLITLFVLLMRLRAKWVRAKRARDFEAASLASGGIGMIVAISLAGMFLGVLDRVVELQLWGVPALALTWPIAKARREEAGREALEPAREGA